jgi:hypothetical protein
MAESQYGKYIITEDLMPPMAPELTRLIEEQARAGNTIDRTLLLGIQDAFVKGAFFVGCEIIWGLTGKGPVTIEAPHTHDFDEIIGFIGTDRSQPRSLNGEIELWLGGEQHILTETCLIFIPRGLTHCPIYFRRVNTPIAMFEACNDVKYEKLR